MLTVRKLDCSLQYGWSILMLLAIPFLFFYGFLLGLFILGWWQLISAACNTSAFMHNSMAKPICNYWKWVSLDLSLLFIHEPLSLFFDPDDLEVITGFALIASVPIAAYYQYIYRKLITQLKLRHEMGGVIKSNHRS